MRILIPKTSDAATTVVEIGKNQNEQPCLPVTFFVVGGDVADTKAVSIKYADDTGSTRAWKQLEKGGTELVLDPDTNYVVIDFPGTFQIAKPADAGEIGIAIA